MKKLSNNNLATELHKNPTKARFINAVPQCSVKPLSKAVTSILKLMYKQIKPNNSKIILLARTKKLVCY